MFGPTLPVEIASLWFQVVAMLAAVKVIPVTLHYKRLRYALTSPMRDLQEEFESPALFGVSGLGSM